MVTASGICVMVVMMISGAPDVAPLSLQYWVVEGSREGRETPFYDGDAQRVRDALEDLRFDTFRTLKRQTMRLRPNQDSRIPLKDRYTLVLRFGGREPDGRARVAATVELAAKEPDTPPKTVVQTNLLLSKEKARIGGLRTETGELILIFAT
ncbi:MAG TPA: hypothetical protein ENN29_14170 [Candidatus Hydrogenedentes bacterium]|nr:hypothetical protein [Candidatus Hydrogenedentota bacterium]